MSNYSYTTGIFCEFCCGHLVCFWTESSGCCKHKYQARCWQFRKIWFEIISERFWNHEVVCWRQIQLDAKRQFLGYNSVFDARIIQSMSDGNLWNAYLSKLQSEVHAAPYNDEVSVAANAEASPAESEQTSRDVSPAHQATRASARLLKQPNKVSYYVPGPRRKPRLSPDDKSIEP